jgi:hypothetical protein
MGWGPNVYVGPQYVPTKPDPHKPATDDASCRRLFRQRLTAVRAALDEPDVKARFDGKARARLAAGIDALEALIGHEFAGA